MRIIDLSAPLEENFIVPQQPWAQDILEMKKVRNIPRDGYQVTQFTLICHTGSHLDAPAHVFTRDEKEGIFYVNEWPLEQLYGETVVLDIQKGEGEEITADDLEKASKDLEVRAGDIVLVYTGWGRYDKVPQEDPKNWLYGFAKRPGLVLCGAEWLIHKKIKAYGQDTAGTQHKKYNLQRSQEAWLKGIHKEEEPVHRTLLKNNIALIEHLTNLDKIVGRRVTCGFFPLPLHGVEAAPIRALAFLDE